MEFDGTTVYVQPLASNKLSLLDYEAYTVVPTVTVLYMIAQGLMGFNNFCEREYEESKWVGYTNLFALLAFSGNLLLQLFRIGKIVGRRDRDGHQAKALIKLHLSLAAISYMSGTAHLITLWNNHGGVCTDAFG